MKINNNEKKNHSKTLNAFIQIYCTHCVIYDIHISEEKRGSKRERKMNNSIQTHSFSNISKTLGLARAIRAPQHIQMYNI